MTPSYISLKETLAFINTGKPFSIVYVTYDKRKGAGGAVKEVQQASKHYQPDKRQASTASTTTIARNPNHFSNSTINIRIPGSPAQIRKVHVQLIRHFNGAIVK